MTVSDPALFDPLAKLYERYADINDEVYRPWLSTALEVDGPRERAVDLGCGSGRFDGLLADRYGQVLAVDIAEREIELARAKRGRPNLDYQVRSILDVSPDTDGQFDLVFSVNALFSVGDHDRLLPHVRSLVRPGGYVLVVDVVSRPATGAPVHRWRGVQDAAQTLVRRRSLSDAWAVLRLRQHKVWMQHARTNRPLSRSDFHRRYGEVFPGAEFTDHLDSFICAIRWQAPAPT